MASKFVWGKGSGWCLVEGIWSFFPKERSRRAIEAWIWLGREFEVSQKYSLLPTHEWGIYASSILCGPVSLGEHQPKTEGPWVLLQTHIVWEIYFPSLTLNLYICEMQVMIPWGLLHRVGETEISPSWWCVGNCKFSATVSACYWESCDEKETVI